MIPRTNYEEALKIQSQFEGNALFQQCIKNLQSNVSYEDFYYALANVFENPGSPEFLAKVNMLFHLYHMKQCGEKIFYITPGLCSKLAQTEVNVDSFFLKSPFREIYVQIDPGLFYMKDPYTKIIPVTGFFIYLQESKGVKQLRVVANGFSKTSDGLGFNAIYYMKTEFKEGKIRDQISCFLKEHLKIDHEALVRFGGQDNIDYWEEFMFFVINILLYITSKNPDFTEYVPPDFQNKLNGLKNVSKKRKFIQRMSKQSGLKAIIVGAGITDQYSKDIKDAGGVGNWKLKNKIRVSGHWRAQWYGSEIEGTRRSETIWINDYEKGPELAEFLNKPFLVK